jgi:phenylacetate-CoA ligase
LEPVDAAHRPTAPGHQSITVLLTSLCRWAQPILRYDLGDSVLWRPDPCPRGDPLPAIKVRGRAADLLSFLRRDGESVGIVPMAFETVIERTPDVDLFQIVQMNPTTLQVRIRSTPGVDPDRVWSAVRTEIVGLLTAHQVGHCTVERAHESPPQAQAANSALASP